MKSILAGNISRYRKEKGFTQEALANELGVTFQAVSKWETGQTMPDVALLSGLAGTLGISVDKLLGYPAGEPGITYYEEKYRSTEDYYWGVTPSPTCLKVLTLMPPENSSRRVKLLDIGCGEGKDAVFFARCGYEVSAFDLSGAGLGKTRRLADKARVHVNAFKADICDYRLDTNYDILYSNGVFHCIKPELRTEVMDNYKAHVNPNGIAAFQAFVAKPFIEPSPEKEEEHHTLMSGQLFTYFHDWLIEHCEEYIFDCNSSGVAHRHAVNKVFARKQV